MNRIFKSILLLFFVNCQLIAQNYSIRGVILDIESGEPLVGASVLLKPNGQGTISNSNGNFSIAQLQKGNYEAEVRYLGYKPIHLELSSQKESAAPVVLLLKSGTYELRDISIKSSTRLVQSNITQYDLSLQPIKSSQDVLRSIPGLFIGQHAGGGKAEQIFLRGFDIDHGTDIALSVDGIPINMVSHAHGQGYSDLHFIIPETIEKIVFEKGAFEVSIGNFSTAGYAAFQTKKVLGKNILKLEGGQFGRFRSLAMIKLLEPKKQTKQNLYLAAEFLRNKGYFESSQKFYRLNTLAKYHARLSTQQALEISLSAFSSQWTASGQIPERAVKQGLISRYGAIDDTEGGLTNRVNFNAQLLTQISPNAVLKNQVYTSYYDFNLKSNFSFFLVDPLFGDQITQSENRMIYGSNNEFILNHKWRNKRAKLNFGISLRRDNIDNVRLYRSLNSVENLEDLSQANVFETNSSLFMKEEIVLSERLRFNAGLRYDFFDFSVENLLNNRDGVSTKKGVFSPKFQVKYDITESLNLFLKHGYGFHSNDSRSILNHSKLNRLPKANGFDLGAFWKLHNSVLINITLWNLNMEEELIFVGDEGIVEASGPTKRLGIDFGIRYQALNWLVASFDANYSHARSSDVPTKESYIPLAPVFTSTGKITASKGNMRTSLHYRSISNRPANEDYTLVADGYFVLDYNIIWTLNAFELGFSVENLLNTDWREAQFATTSQLQGENSSVTEMHFTPGTPLQALLSLAYTF